MTRVPDVDGSKCILIDITLYNVVKGYKSLLCMWISDSLATRARHPPPPPTLQSQERVTVSLQILAVISSHRGVKQNRLPVLLHARLSLGSTVEYNRT
jgi:hypothetical protein